MNKHAIHCNKCHDLKVHIIIPIFRNHLKTKYNVEQVLLKAAELMRQEDTNYIIRYNIKYIIWKMANGTNVINALFVKYTYVGIHCNYQVVSEEDELKADTWIIVQLYIYIYNDTRIIRHRKGPRKDIGWTELSNNPCKI